MGQRFWRDFIDGPQLRLALWWLSATFVVWTTSLAALLLSGGADVVDAKARTAIDLMFAALGLLGAIAALIRLKAPPLPQAAAPAQAPSQGQDAAPFLASSPRPPWFACNNPGCCNCDDLQSALSAAKLGTWRCSHGEYHTHLDQTAQLLTGLPAEATRAEILALIHPDDLPAVRNKLERIEAGTEHVPGYTLQYRIHPRNADGIRWIRSTTAIQWDAQTNKPVGTLGCWQDVTEEQTAKEALHSSEQQLRVAFAAARAGAYDFDLRTMIMTFSPEVRAVLDLSDRNVLPLAEVLKHVHPEDRDLAERSVKSLSKTGSTSPARLVIRFMNDAGQMRYLYWSGRTLFSPEGVPIRNTGVCLDLTAEYEAQERIRRSEERLRLALSGAEMTIFDTNLETRTIAFSDEICLWYGIKPGTVLSFEDALALIHPEDRERVAAGYGAILAGRDDLYIPEVRPQRTDGATKWLTWSGKVIYRQTPTGAIPSRVITLARDISKERAAQASMVRSEEQTKLAAQIASLGMVDIDLATGSFFISPLLRQTIGLPDPARLTDAAWWSMCHPDDEAEVRAAVAKARDPRGTGEFSRTHRVICRDGKERWFKVLGKTLFEGENDARTATRSIYVYQDVTQELLRDQQAVQARRLEAIGRLAGGIAHDFNNTLAVIGGNLELVAANPAPEQARKHLEEAIKGVQLGRRTIKRLLTFARNRQLDPSPIDINELVGSIRDLVAPILRSSVRVQCLLRANPATVSVDPSELESSVLNLVFNARDAMRDGGLLVIETETCDVDPSHVVGDLAPGRYVAIHVSDTGTGMSAAVLSRVFEPFFSTKEPGKGSGLGLATTHGFVVQSKGHVAIASEVGKGTRVSIYLPLLTRNAETIALTRRELAPARQTDVRRRVLVVDDNPQILSVCSAMLERLNYQVAVAESADRALALIREGEPLDLVLSDIVMATGASGWELREALREARPDLPVLLMTGYVSDKQRSSIDNTVLEKPFSVEDLSRALAQLNLPQKP